MLVQHRDVRDGWYYIWDGILHVKGIPSKGNLPKSMEGISVVRVRERKLKTLREVKDGELFSFYGGKVIMVKYNKCVYHFRGNVLWKNQYRINQHIRVDLIRL